MRPTNLKTAGVVLLMVSTFGIVILHGSLERIARKTFSTENNEYDLLASRRRADRARGAPHLAVAICGDRLHEPLTMLKTAVLFSRTFFIIHIFSDNEAVKDQVATELESWPKDIKATFRYHLNDASFPQDIQCKGCRELKWETLFKPCATQRLFLPDVLQGVDSVLYVDADTLFFAPIEEIWSYLHRFNSTQLMGAVSISEIPKDGPYYKRDAHMPFFGPTGINSGLLLMNLTRMRESTWKESIAEILLRFKEAGEANLYDQALINAYLHQNPQNGYLLSCDWNFRDLQCYKCNQARETGVAFMHGYRQAFTKTGFLPTFRAIYSAFHRFKIGHDTVKGDLLPKMQHNLRRISTQGSHRHDICTAHKAPVYTARLLRHIRQEEEMDLHR